MLRIFKKFNIVITIFALLLYSGMTYAQALSIKGEKAPVVAEEKALPKPMEAPAISEDAPESKPQEALAIEEGEDSDFSKKEARGFLAQLRKHKVQSGLLYNMNIPMGDFGEIMNPGYASFFLFAEGEVPDKLVRLAKIDTALKLSKIPFKQLRLSHKVGFGFGYTSFLSKTKEESVYIRNDNEQQWHINPWLLYVKLIRPFPFGSQIIINPFVQTGFGLGFQGATTVSPSGKELGSESSVGTLWSFGAGSGLQLKSIRFVEFYFDLRYFHVFESISGNFMNVAIGAAYAF